MRFDRKDPPRTFTVGNGIEIHDHGNIRLAPNEQVTFLTQGGAEYDIVRKDWGFYATPSLDGRLEGFGLRGVLIQNRTTKRHFVLLVERGKEPAFETYLADEGLRVVCWLDSADACRTVDFAVNGSAA
ncbi:MAG TPA: hypothetical protein VEY95_14290 [Azospirillaceae bacterium]|nr:hypothetical protein [Azospirillaceae bacterium]